MATINQIYYDIVEAVKEYSDDSELDFRYVIYLVNIKRSKYLKQKLDALGRNFNNRVLQTLCIGLEEVSANECGLDIDCSTILRTKRPIPNLLQLSTKEALERVSPSNKLSSKFNIIPREKAPMYASAPFSKGIKAFLHNDNYIYLISSDKIFTECISITGVFEDPLALQDYSTCCDCKEESSCYDLDTTDYPLQTELLDLVRLDIINELAKLKQIKEDKNNDSNNE